MSDFSQFCQKKHVRNMTQIKGVIHLLFFFFVKKKILNSSLIFNGESCCSSKVSTLYN